MSMKSKWLKRMRKVLAWLILSPLFAASLPFMVAILAVMAAVAPFLWAYHVIMDEDGDQ